MGEEWVLRADLKATHEGLHEKIVEVGCAVVIRTHLRGERYSETERGIDDDSTSMDGGLQGFFKGLWENFVVTQV